MAGAKYGEFKELISPFLKSKIIEAKDAYGENSPQYQAIYKQYVKSPLEDEVLESQMRRHYESEVKLQFNGRDVKGVERLYRRTILIEPTTACAAHCRWCLRGQYPIQTLKEDDITHAAKYIGSDKVNADINEVLITGGDPLMSISLLTKTLKNLNEFSPNIKIVRIGSRVPFQSPDKVNDAMLDLFCSFPDFRFELGVNVNHPVEFWPESVAALTRLQSIGFRIYNQHPLLKGVNDNVDTLVHLYSLLREYGIEAHYLFHAIPMRGMDHHRTSLDRGLALANEISSCGEFSGRTKPRYAVLSDIGKIVIYENTIIERKNNLLLLKSGFKLEERLKWNPSWEKPESLIVDENGYMYTWYIDGHDD